ncbi:hypothetical protein [Chromobacterium sphagni]|uniref:Uncharacterized protein n=1 Tax=Chromobacterium sphagni TaxID=1903179 RepID=A0A1S1WWS1_9NEIS|nr:hypothetical protein [Chromobacterium sphagni]OHX11495.1 hypothetical protein BI347_17670 [Chromobacterium sphagni]OHX17778.1 hypothetical protein BI344_20455 [Chromobacterium sphagni]
MEFLFDLDDPLQCLEQIYQQLSPMVVALHPQKHSAKAGPCFGSGLLLSYRGERFIVTAEAVLAEACVAHGQQVLACSGELRLPLQGLACASPQHMDIAAIHLPAPLMARHPLEHCFEMGFGGTPDPLASAFTLLLGYPVRGPKPANLLNDIIGLVSRAYRSDNRRSQVIHPLFVEFDSRDILSRSKLDKPGLLERYRLCGAPAVSLYHSFQDDSNRLTAYLQGVVIEWDRAGIGATASSTSLLPGFLDNFLQQLQRGDCHGHPAVAELLEKYRR